MNKTLKISLIFIFIIFLFSLKSFAFDSEIINGGITATNITSNTYSNFELNTIYLSEYTNNVYNNFVPIYVNDTDFIFLYYSNSYSSSSTTYNVPFTNLNYHYYINNTKIQPSFTTSFKDSSNNLTYTPKRSIVFYDNQFIYMFSVCDWSNDYLQYCGGLYKDSNNNLDFIVGEVRIIFEKYDYINNVKTEIYKGVTPTNPFSFNTYFSSYNLNNYNVIPCYNYVASVNYQMGLTQNNLSYTLTFSDESIAFNNNSNFDYVLYNSNGSIPVSFDFNDIIFPNSEPIVTKNVSFVFDDYNLMKRFKYNVNLPLFSEYSKYFAFLKEVDRANGNEVYLTLDIYIIDLPSEYLDNEDYRDIFNWLMYDSDSSKCVFPYGMRLKHLNAYGKNNSSMSVSLVDTSITSRMSSDSSIMNKIVSNLSDNYTSTYIFPRSTIISSNFLSSLIIYAFTDFTSLNVPIIR